MYALGEGGGQGIGGQQSVAYGATGVLIACVVGRAVLGLVGLPHGLCPDIAAGPVEGIFANQSVLGAMGKFTSSVVSILSCRSSGCTKDTICDCNNASDRTANRADKASHLLFSSCHNDHKRRGDARCRRRQHTLA